MNDRVRLLLTEEMYTDTQRLAALYDYVRRIYAEEADFVIIRTGCIDATCPGGSGCTSALSSIPGGGTDLAGAYANGEPYVPGT